MFPHLLRKKTKKLHGALTGVFQGVIFIVETTIRHAGKVCPTGRKVARAVDATHHFLQLTARADRSHYRRTDLQRSYFFPSPIQPCLKTDISNSIRTHSLEAAAKKSLTSFTNQQKYICSAHQHVLHLEFYYTARRRTPQMLLLLHYEAMIHDNARRICQAVFSSGNPELDS